MKNRIPIAAFVATLALPVLAQVPSGGTLPKDSSQIRDDNHDIRPDRVDQRSSSVGMNANEARDLRRKQIREMKKQQKLEKEQYNDARPPKANTPSPGDH